MLLIVCTIRLKVEINFLLSTLLECNIKFNDVMIKYVITLALLIVAGCATQHLAQKREKLIQQGFSNDYTDGYVHGCSSGYNRAGDRYYDFSRDMPRYQSDQNYSKGWDEGYQSCKAEYESLMKTFDTLTSD